MVSGHPEVFSGVVSITEPIERLIASHNTRRSERQHNAFPVGFFGIPVKAFGDFTAIGDMVAIQAERIGHIDTVPVGEGDIAIGTAGCSAQTVDLHIRHLIVDDDDIFSVECALIASHIIECVGIGIGRDSTVFCQQGGGDGNGISGYDELGCGRDTYTLPR